MTYLGLLLISEKLFGKGLGRKSYQVVEDYIQRVFASNTIRLGISSDNDVTGFWRAMGFQANGHSYSWQGENKTTNVIEYDKGI